MKLQVSEPSGPESLQSQTRPWPKKRLSISRLSVFHRRLAKQASIRRSLSANRRSKAKRVAKKGEGDRGDQPRRSH
jgi:hypothetical protein